MIRKLSGGVVCLALLALAGAALAQQPTAQPATTGYRVTQYLKVPAETESAYLEFLRTNTRKIIRQEMQSGEVLSWAVLKLTYEGSPALEYNYVATTLFAGPPVDLTDDAEAQLIQRATGMSYQEYQQKIGGLRTRTGSMLGVTEAVVPGTQTQEGNFIALSRWKIQPMQGEAYADFVQNMLLPLQIQNQKDGHHLGWTAGRTLYPGGGDAKYDATVATMYKDLASAAKILSPSEMEARFAKAHPKEDYDSFRQRSQTVRRQVRTELFKVVIADDATRLTSSVPGETTPSSTVAGRP